jgi:DMSO/TMAO reductase YedYZ molybdopterin-dependent catalytic subunit
LIGATAPPYGGEFCDLPAHRFTQKLEDISMHPNPTRRELLKLTPLLALGAFTVPSIQDRWLRAGLKWSDALSEFVWGARRKAETFPDSAVTPLERFPYNTYDVHEPEIDFASWTLTVEGDVQRPGEYTLAQIQSLPRRSQNVRHICIEGWSVTGSFSGARLSDFLESVGANPSARFVEVTCHDDYYTSYDMESCRHSQTLLCYEMYGRPLDRGHGAPLRIHMPVKLGYKSAKYLLSLRVTNVLRAQRGFWEDQGYAWYAGI